MILTSGTTGTPKGASRKQPETIGPAVALLSRIPLKARETHVDRRAAVPLVGLRALHARADARLDLRAAAQVRPRGDAVGDRAAPGTPLPMVPVMVQRIMELPERRRTKYDLSSLRGRPALGLGAARRPRRQVHGRVRRHPLQPLRLDRGRLGDDRDAGRPARRARHRRRSRRAARRPDLRRGRPRAAARRDRPHLRRQRDAVRGLHRRRLEGRDRRAHDHRRRRLPRRRRAGCSSRAATTT